VTGGEIVAMQFRSPFCQLPAAQLAAVQVASTFSSSAWAQVPGRYGFGLAESQAGDMGGEGVCVGDCVVVAVKTNRKKHSSRVRHGRGRAAMSKRANRQSRNMATSFLMHSIVATSFPIAIGARPALLTLRPALAMRRYAASSDDSY